MNKHTPGPWKAQCPTYNEWHVYSQHHPSGVVTYLRGEFLNETAKANAALIAAAPDLLAACQAALEWAKTPGPHGGNPYCHEFIKLAEAAIAKAQPTNEKE